MDDEPQTVAEKGPRPSFAKELSSAAAKKALTPLAAAAATAGTAYLTRKSAEVWQEKVLPKVREKGGSKAVAMEAFQKVSDRFGGRGSEALSGLAQRLGDKPADEAPPAEQEPAASVEAPKPEASREEQRRQRQQRREERQRALEQSSTT